MSFGSFGGPGGGAMGGGALGGGARSAAAPGGGLPFAGIPPELQKGVDKLLDTEPEHPEPEAKFTYRAEDDSGTRLTLRALIFRHWHLGLAAAVLVTIVSVANQAGPKLIDIGISSGMTGPHKRFVVVLVVVVVFLAWIAITALAQRAQVKVTG